MHDTHVTPLPVVRASELTPECVHCGLCLQACPTYLELGQEADSPRGRIYLMRAQQRGVLHGFDGFVQHISACLDCRACESACPSGVPYGEMVEKAREVIEEESHRPFFVRVLRRLFFNIILPSPGNLRLAIKLLRFYQRSAIQGMVHTLGILKLLPGRLDQLEQLLPDLKERTKHVPLGKVYPAEGVMRHRVGLLTGCVMNEIFGEINQATIRVLQRNGCEVVVPKGQGCCGALHCHAGVMGEARDLACRNIEAFEQVPVEVILSNASGCGAKLKEYPALLAANPEWSLRARTFTAKVQDISAFLDQIPQTAIPGRIEARVAYDDPCHLLHAMKVSQPPRNLLRRIPGLDLVELRTPDQCCGSAGIYNLTHYELSMRILDRKIADIRKAAVDMVATGNPGCILQITHGLKRAGLNGVKVLHPIEILDRSYSTGAMGDGPLQGG
ncbi:MAG: (Fe-S)-binding protein [Terriglobia bacterium]